MLNLQHWQNPLSLHATSATCARTKRHSQLSISRSLLCSGILSISVHLQSGVRETTGECRDCAAVFIHTLIMPANILAIPLKSARPLGSHLAEAIRTYISEHYTDTHPDAFAADIKEFVRVRDECCRLDSHQSFIAAVQK